MTLRISLAQINPTTGDLAGNSRKIIRGIERARQEGADLVVFPEMCLPGYCLDEKLLINLGFLRANRRFLLEEIAPVCQDIAAVVGFLDSDETRRGPDSRVIRYNAAAVIQDGQVSNIVRKRLLPSYRYFEDKRYFEPGREAEPVPVRGREGVTPIGVLICEDLWDDGYDFKPTEVYCQRGAELLVCINASPFVASKPGREDGKRFRRREQIRRKIAKHHVPVAYVNTVGIGDNGKNIIPYDGASVVYDSAGRLVCALAAFAEDQQTLTLEQRGAPECPEPSREREEEIYLALSMAVRDYYRKVGIFKGVLEAVSGGIDSALGTAIAHEAMGPELVTLYNLPSKFNSAVTQRLAQELAENFGLAYHVIPIQAMVDRVVEDFEHYLHPVRDPVTIENLQSRIRGLIMMAESNDRQALLLTNGNETEIALGYATLYGDMVGGLSVIGDLPKTDVYRLARYVNRRWGRPVIPEGIFQIPASAELREGQVDPFDYEVVAPLVNELAETGWGPEEFVEQFRNRSLSADKYSTGVTSIYDRYTIEEFRDLTFSLYRSMNNSVYKRLQGAPIIAVSDRAFGFDLRETIINGWKA